MPAVLVIYRLKTLKNHKFLFKWKSYTIKKFGYHPHLKDKPNGLSDKVYVFDDGQLVKNISRSKKIKTALDKSNHKILNVQDLDYSDKVDLFSLIKEDLNSISKK